MALLDASWSTPARRTRPLTTGVRQTGISAHFAGDGRVVIENPARFSSLGDPAILGFLELGFGIRGVREVEIDTFHRQAVLHGDRDASPALLLRKFSRIFRGVVAPDLRPILAPGLLEIFPAAHPRLRLFRFGEAISFWEPRRLGPGFVQLRNAYVLGKPGFVQAVERELSGLAGVENFRVSPLAGSLEVSFNPRQIDYAQIVRHLDAAIRQAPAGEPTRRDGALRVATVSLAVSAGASFVTPALLPAGALLMLYTAVPSFQRAYRALAVERKLRVDVLDSIIFVACLFTGQIFAGAMTAWFLSLGRKLLEQTQRESARVLQQIFGRQAATAHVLRDGVETEVPLEEIHAGDLIVVHAGGAVPADGVVAEGDAMIDQHALTGEATPAEKTSGDRVFASTLLLAGKIIVRVERAGRETAAGQIGEILMKTVSHKLRAQSRGEELADRAVLPTLGLAALAGGVGGVSSALAVINSESGTGIRLAAPLGLLTSITLCAQHGILVKDGSALELMSGVDTVLFDKTGTLTRDKPEVCRIFACGDYEENHVLECAAAAEQKFSHPIARAILERFAKLGRPLPVLDASKYKVGYGITVELNRQTVRVGSRRFLEQEGISVPENIDREMRDLHAEGHSFVCVAIENRLAGVLELQASQRPEVEEIVSGLRARGVDHMAIISGDHDRPTRRLAEHLGMDRYFAEVLPQDKGRYVELLQNEGRKVCFVGDGINDSIALKKADVSISLRGASTIATDTAQVVFMENGLSRICDLVDISRNLERNVRRSWNLILIPNGICVAGVFLFGFNIWHSVLFNNLSAIAALANGMLPLRQAARLHSRRERELAAEFEAQIRTAKL